jgi:hypothetical protein
MNVNALPTERLAILGSIDPDFYPVGTYQTGFIALKDHGRFCCIVQAGELDIGATIDAKLVAYIPSVSATNITGAVITQITQADGGSDKQAVINLSVDALAGAPETHLRLVITVGGTQSDVSAIVLGFDPRHAPADDNDASTVNSITSV